MKTRLKMFWCLLQCFDFNSFLASDKFCCLLITFVNSLDPDQNWQNFGAYQNPSCLILWCYSCKNILKKAMLKNICRRQNHEKLPSMQRVNRWFLTQYGINLIWVHTSIDTSNYNSRWLKLILVPSAHNLCKQIGPRSGPTKCQAWSGSNLFYTRTIFLK